MPIVNTIAVKLDALFAGFRKGVEEASKALASAEGRAKAYSEALARAEQHSKAAGSASSRSAAGIRTAEEAIKKFNTVTQRGRTDLAAFIQEHRTLGDVVRSASGFIAGFNPLLAAIGAAAGIAALGLNKLIDETTKVGDELLTLSNTTDLSVEQLSRLSVGAELAGTSLPAVQSSVRFLSRILAQAANGSESAAARFRQLGVDFRDTSGKIKPLNQLMGEIGDSLSKVENAALRAGKAQLVYGFSAGRSLPFLGLAAEEQRKLTEELAIFGREVSTGFAVASDRYRDNLLRLRLVNKGLGQELAEQTLPVFNSLLELLLKGALILKSTSAAFDLFALTIDRVFLPLQRVVDASEVSADVLKEQGASLDKVTNKVTLTGDALRKHLDEAAGKASERIRVLDDAVVNMGKSSVTASDKIEGLDAGLDEIALNDADEGIDRLSDALERLPLVDAEKRIDAAIAALGTTSGKSQAEVQRLGEELAGLRNKLKVEDLQSRFQSVFESLSKEPEEAGKNFVALGERIAALGGSAARSGLEALIGQVRSLGVELPNTTRHLEELKAAIPGQVPLLTTELQKIVPALEGGSKAAEGLARQLLEIGTPRALAQYDELLSRLIKLGNAGDDAAKRTARALIAEQPGPQISPELREARRLGVDETRPDVFVGPPRPEPEVLEARRIEREEEEFVGPRLEGFEELREEIQNTEDALGALATNFTDALVATAQGGKLAFKDFFKSLAIGLAKAIAQAIILSAILSIFGFGAGAGGFGKLLRGNLLKGLGGGGTADEPGVDASILRAGRRSAGNEPAPRRRRIFEAPGTLPSSKRRVFDEPWADTFARAIGQGSVMAGAGVHRVFDEPGGDAFAQSEGRRFGMLFSRGARSAGEAVRLSGISGGSTAQATQVIVTPEIRVTNAGPLARVEYFERGQEQRLRRRQRELGGESL
jgi:hypothetical protein